MTEEDKADIKTLGETSKEYLKTLSKVRDLNSLRLRLDTLKNQEFTITINGKTYLLCDDTIADEKLTLFLNRMQDEYTIGAKKTLDPLEFLNAIENALTDEPTQLFLRIRQVIEWYENKQTGQNTQKAASHHVRANALFDALLKMKYTGFHFELIDEHILELWGPVPYVGQVRRLAEDAGFELSENPERPVGNMVFRVQDSNLKGSKLKALKEAIVELSPWSKKKVWTRTQMTAPFLWANMVYVAKHPEIDANDVEFLPIEDVLKDPEAKGVYEAAQDVEEQVSLFKPVAGEGPFRMLVEIFKKYKSGLERLPRGGGGDTDYVEQVVMLQKKAVAYVRYSRALKEARQVPPISKTIHEDYTSGVYEDIREAAKEAREGRPPEEWGNPPEDYIEKFYEKNPKRLENLVESVTRMKLLDDFVFNHMDGPTILASDAAVLCGDDFPEILLKRIEKGVTSMRDGAKAVLDVSRAIQPADFINHIAAIANSKVDAIVADMVREIKSKSGRVPVVLVWRALVDLKKKG